MSVPLVAGEGKWQGTGTNLNVGVEIAKPRQQLYDLGIVGRGCPVDWQATIPVFCAGLLRVFLRVCQCYHLGRYIV